MGDWAVRRRGAERVFGRGDKPSLPIYTGTATTSPVSPASSTPAVTPTSVTAPGPTSGPGGQRAGAESQTVVTDAH